MDLNQRGFTFMLSMLISMVDVEAFAHDIEVAGKTKTESICRSIWITILGITTSQQ